MTGSVRVFVSYRRQDTRHVAGRLADRLVERFQVFMDMDTIEPGSDFGDVIQKAVDDCDVFLPVIGPEWAGVDPTTGLRRLDDPTDWVGAETVAALQRGVPVIPVLVDGALMPAPAELPETLAPLARRQAMSIRHESFSSDVSRLIEAIERRLGPTEPRSPGAAGAADTAPHPAADPARVGAAYTAALAAFFAHRWPEAVEAFEEVLALDPSHPGAAGRLAEARRNAQLSTWNSQADKAASEGRWADAVVQLENVRSLDPNYPDLNRRLQAATTKRRIGDLHRDIRSLAAVGQWPAVLAAGQELAALDPGRADPDGLVTRAQAESAQAALEERYAEGLAELDRGSAGTAMGHFEAVMREQPGFQDVQALYAEARQRHLAELQALGAQAGWSQTQPTPGYPLVGPPPPPGPPGQVPGRPAGGAPPPAPGRRRTGLIIAAAMLLVVALATGGVLLLRDRLGNREAAGPPAGTASTAAESSSSSETATPSPSPTSNTSELRTHIPTAILPNCQDYSPPAGDPLEADLVGAVSCELTAAGAPKTVWYFLYGDTAAMNTAYNAYITGEFKTDDCLQAREKLDYNVEVDGKKDPAGVLHCYDSDGATYFAWTHDVLRIVTFAEDKDLSYAQMKKWWNGAGPIR